MCQEGSQVPLHCGIIDHQSKLIRYLDHLDTPLTLATLESFDDVLLRYPEMTADCNSCQGIVDTELTWNVDLYWEVEKAFTW